MMDTRIYKRGSIVMCRERAKGDGDEVAKLCSQGWRYMGLINVDADVIRGLIDHVHCWPEVMEAADDDGHLQSFQRVGDTDIRVSETDNCPVCSQRIHQGESIHKGQ